MYPPCLQQLVDLFQKFPGIGPRQAARFVFFLLKQKESLLRDLQSALRDLETKIHWCAQCFRAMEEDGVEAKLCNLCRNPKRDHASLAVVEKESDLQNLEKTGAFRGLYHMLGDTLSPLDADSPRTLHLRELYGRVQSLLEKHQRVEVILATSSTTEGDTTALYIDRVLTPLKNQHPGLAITRLGRGLSLGTELEYADEVTLKNALKNRK